MLYILVSRCVCNLASVDASIAAAKDLNDTGWVTVSSELSNIIYTITMICK